MSCLSTLAHRYPSSLVAIPIYLRRRTVCSLFTPCTEVRLLTLACSWLLPAPEIEEDTGSAAMPRIISSINFDGDLEPTLGAQGRRKSTRPTVFDHVSSAFCQNMDYRMLVSCGKMSYGRALVLVGLALMILAVSKLSSNNHR